jgi:hypothetical protein
MKKLCKWKKKRIQKRRHELLEMLAEPTWMCRKCARAADTAERLCKPAPIDRNSR